MSICVRVRQTYINKDEGQGARAGGEVGRGGGRGGGREGKREEGGREGGKEGGRKGGREEGGVTCSKRPTILMIDGVSSINKILFEGSNFPSLCPCPCPLPRPSPSPSP